jgi:UDP-N-acetylmuramoyl-tripeptide--D-alanyl-D-alanine ligase
LAASAACLSLGIDFSQIKRGLETMSPVTGRLQLLRGKRGNLIINDSYNANPSSLLVALDVLQQCVGDCWVVLGAFGELGVESKKMHEEIGALIKSRRVVRLLAVGSDAENSVRIFGKGAIFFKSQKDLMAALDRELTGTETLLVKGSRAQQMEKVVAALVAQKGK